METRWRYQITPVASAENGAISVERVKVGKREKPTKCAQRLLDPLDHTSCRKYWCSHSFAFAL